jgi:hypothetical protein
MPRRARRTTGSVGRPLLHPPRLLDLRPPAETQRLGAWTESACLAAADPLLICRIPCLRQVDFGRVLQMLESGAARVAESDRRIGRDAIRIASDDDHSTYFVDAATHDPMELRTYGDGAAQAFGRPSVSSCLPPTRTCGPLTSRRRTRTRMWIRTPVSTARRRPGSSPRADGGCSRGDAQGRRSRGCTGARRGCPRAARGPGLGRTEVSRRALPFSAKRRGFISMVGIGRRCAGLQHPAWPPVKTPSRPLTAPAPLSRRRAAPRPR